MRTHETERARWAANREKIHEQRRVRREINGDHIRMLERIRGARWRAAHPSKFLEGVLSAKAANPAKYRAIIRRWSRANPEAIQAIKQRRRARQRALPATLTVKQWQTIKAQYKYCCAYCGKRQKRLTQDHITPVTKGGGTTLWNIIPACQSCNSKKGSRGVLKPVQPLLL